MRERVKKKFTRDRIAQLVTRLIKKISIRRNKTKESELSVMNARPKVELTIGRTLNRKSQTSG